MNNLKKFSTSDLCDEYLDKIKIAKPSGLKNYGGRKKFYGLIQTVKCFEDNPLVKKAIEQDGEGKVLIVDGASSLRCALLGDIMAGISVKNLWNGIIIAGCIRDSEALAVLDTGIMALNTNPLKSAKIGEGQENVIVHFAGIDFIPGEFVYCDEDGIIVSPELLI